MSETCRQTTIEIVKRAQALGLPVSFDVNYRAMLWEKEKAKKTFDEILPHVNIIIATQPDAVVLLGKERSPQEMLRELQAQYSCDIVVLTLSSEGSMAFDGDEFYEGFAYPIEEQVNRLGAGDAFDAGLLYGYLKPALESFTSFKDRLRERFDLQMGLSYGGAMAALKHTVPQNIPILNKEDIERLIFGKKTDILR